MVISIMYFNILDFSHSYKEELILLAYWLMYLF
jgi:hypothetical protein